jgi:integrase
MYKRGERWYSDFLFEGERFTKSHGKISKSVAERKDKQFYNEVASGGYAKKMNDPRFNVALKSHLKWSKQNNRPGTYRANTNRAKHLKTFFGKRRVSKIAGNKRLMEQYLETRKAEIKAFQMRRGRTEDEVTYSTVNRELALLSKMFNELIKAGKATRNPVSLIERLPEYEKERILTSDEVAKILDAIDKADVRYKHLKDVFIIGLNTAMRLGEILGIEKSWIDLKTGIINVPRYSQKRGRKDKRVPINFVIRPILSRRMRKTKKYLFVNPDTGRPLTSVHNAWESILKKAGIGGKAGVDKLRLHDLRHTAATMLARSGKDIKFIAQYLGHADVKTTARYIHYQDEDLKQGADALANSPINSHNTPKAVAAKP